MNIDFNGKSVIVTGAGHGFGRAIAHAFCARGAVTFACDVNEAGLTVTAAEAKPAQGGRLTVATVDVTDRKAVGAFVDGVGRVDVLVNNAGGVCGQVGQPLEQVTPRQWQEIFDVNVTGAFNFAQAVAPAMKAARAGRIVNISSGAGLGVSLTGIQAYAAAKAAQIGLTRCDVQSKTTRGSVVVELFRTELKKLSVVVSIAPSSAAAVLLNVRILPLITRRAWLGPTSPMLSCSSPPTMPAGSPVRSSR